MVTRLQSTTALVVSCGLPLPVEATRVWAAAGKATATAAARQIEFNSLLMGLKWLGMDILRIRNMGHSGSSNVQLTHFGKEEGKGRALCLCANNN